MKFFFNKLFKTLKYILFSFIGMLFIYFLFAVILSIIPVNSKSQNLNVSHTIYLASNGVHLDIILPAKDTNANWFQFFQYDSLLIPSINYLAFGWGDKEFYIHTPEWSDLTFKKAFQTIFLKGKSAMHVSPYREVSENRNIIKIRVSDSQYHKLVTYIQDSFEKDNTDILNKFTAQGYGKYDHFYSAKRSYNLFFTCNTWVNKAFKQSGIRACLWTPFDKGLFYQVRKLGSYL